MGHSPGPRTGTLTSLDIAKVTRQVGARTRARQTPIPQIRHWLALKDGKHNLDHTDNGIDDANGNKEGPSLGLHESTDLIEHCDDCEFARPGAHQTDVDRYPHPLQGGKEFWICQVDSMGAQASHIAHMSEGDAGAAKHLPGVSKLQCMTESMEEREEGGEIPCRRQGNKSRSSVGGP